MTIEIYVKGNLRRRLHVAGAAAEINTEIWDLLYDDYHDAPYTVGTLGDVNGDGEINAGDALRTARYGVLLEVDGFNIGVADVDCSGTVDIVDAHMMARYGVGLITEFSCVLP
jgi:hypothetical protein